MQRVNALEEKADEQPVVLPDEVDAWTEFCIMRRAIDTLIADGLFIWPTDAVRACWDELDQMKHSLRGLRPANGDINSMMERMKRFSHPFLELLSAASDI
jgi:hypothetical protein